MFWPHLPILCAWTCTSPTRRTPPSRWRSLRSSRVRHKRRAPSLPTCSIQSVASMRLARAAPSPFAYRTVHSPQGLLCSRGPTLVVVLAADAVVAHGGQDFAGAGDTRRRNEFFGIPQGRPDNGGRALKIDRR